ncbi:MAG: endolytic transglycosylase MltG [Steroidobacteraceae bacterium]
MRALRNLLLLLVLIALAAGWAWWHSAQLLLQPLQVSAAQRVKVPAGRSLRTLLAELGEQGVISEPTLIAWRLRLFGPPVALKSGVYALAPGMTLQQLLQNLATGRVLLEQLTIVEGWSFAQMRAALAAQEGLEHDCATLDDAALMQKLGHAGQAAEGRFFPDTYRFAYGSQESAIYTLAYQRMQSELAQAWNARAADLPVSSPDEALTLASIVEKETGRENERPLVAAVFINRLRQGMRLQSDPTVIYGLGDRYDGNIHVRDLRTDTVYNTYTRAGLPPTPIALPGAASLQATLHPADSAALYFVAHANGDGGHYFSATLAEHERHVRELVSAARSR